jgi:hypothetical protein
MLKTAGILALAVGTCGAPSDAGEDEPEVYVSVEELPDGGVRRVEAPVDDPGVAGTVMEMIGSIPFLGEREGLNGISVSFSVHCCTAPPTDGNLISEVLEATVGDGVEFSNINAAGSRVIGANIDLSDQRIVLEFTAARVAAGGSFNGYVFAVDPLGPPRYVWSATLSDGSTVPEGSSVVTHDDRTIYVNNPGLRTEVGMRIVIDVDVQSDPPGVVGGPRG